MTDREPWWRMALMWGVFSLFWLFVLWPNAVLSMGVSVYSYRRYLRGPA